MIILTYKNLVSYNVTMMFPIQFTKRTAPTPSRPISRQHESADIGIKFEGSIPNIFDTHTQIISDTLKFILEITNDSILDFAEIIEHNLYNDVCPCFW